MKGSQSALPEGYHSSTVQQKVAITLASWQEDIKTVSISTVSIQERPHALIRRCCMQLGIPCKLKLRLTLPKRHTLFCGFVSTSAYYNRLVIILIVPKHCLVIFCGLAKMNWIKCDILVLVEESQIVNGASLRFGNSQESSAATSRRAIQLSPCLTSSKLVVWKWSESTICT